jgi:hypothetical protein
MRESRDWWAGIRQTAFFAGAEQVEAEPDTVDPAAIELADWAEHREQLLGLGGYDTGDFIGLGDSSGLPDWRHPFVPEQVEPTDPDQHIEARAAAGVKTASAVFGADPPRPRRNSSPWSV